MSAAQEIKALPYHLSGNMASHVQAIARGIFPRPWLWLLLTTIIAVDTFSFVISARFSFDASSISRIFLGIPLVLVLAWWRGRNVNKLPVVQDIPSQLCMLIMFMSSSIVAITVLNYITMSSAFPMQQANLSGWDKALGFDWLTYGETISQFQPLKFVLMQSYDAMFLMLILIASGAIITGDSSRANELVALTVTTSLAVILIGAFFPAVSAMDVEGTASFKAQFPPMTGNWFMAELEHVRSGAPIHLEANHMTGLVQFPSFHVIGGLLIMYGCHGNVWRFVLGACLGSILILATPLYGGHYYVDLIAGTAVGACAIAIGHLFGSWKTRRTEPP